MKVGHLYVVYTVLAKPPKEKLVVCICAREALFFWLNSEPRAHGIGQLPLEKHDHPALSRDCVMDCSRVTTFNDSEIDDAKDRGRFDDEVIGRITAYLENFPPKTLAPRFLNLARNNLSVC